jgi:hypothetical protein
MGPLARRECVVGARLRSRLARAEPPGRSSRARYLVQQIVDGLVGAKSPVGLPPWAAHAPSPEATPADSAEAAATQPAGPVAGAAADAQVESTKADTFTLAHETPVGASHVHAVHVRASLAAAKYCGRGAVYIPVGHGDIPARTTQYVSDSKPMSVGGAHTLPPAQEPALALAGPHSLALCVHGAAPASAVACGVQAPGAPTGRAKLTEAPPGLFPGPPPPPHATASSAAQVAPTVTVPQGFEHLSSLKSVAIGVEQVTEGAPQAHEQLARVGAGDAKPTNAVAGYAPAHGGGSAMGGPPSASKNSNGPCQPAGAAAAQTHAPGSAPAAPASRLGIGSSKPQMLAHPTPASPTTPASAARRKLSGCVPDA